MGSVPLVAILGVNKVKMDGAKAAKLTSDVGPRTWPYLQACVPSALTLTPSIPAIRLHDHAS